VCHFIVTFTCYSAWLRCDWNMFWCSQFHTCRLHLFVCVNSKLSEYGVQRGSDGSVSVSDSVLVKVSGADEDTDKEVLVSWSLQVSKMNGLDFLLWLIVMQVVAPWLGARKGFWPAKTCYSCHQKLYFREPIPTWSNLQKRPSSSFLACTTSTTHRHQPAQRTVLGQVDCFVHCEVVGSEIALDDVPPRDMKRPWWSLPVVWWGSR